MIQILKISIKIFKMEVAKSLPTTFSIPFQLTHLINNICKNFFQKDEEAIKGGKRCHETISVQGSDTTMKP